MGLHRYIGIVFLLVLLACETEPILFKGSYHVRFTESSLTKKESFSQTILIGVHLVAPAQEEELAINYEISGSARENVDYQIIGTRGVVALEEGEYFGTITIKLINNANNILRKQDVVLTLRSTSSDRIQVGQGEGGIGKKYTLTIEDDCILGGSYRVTRGITTDVSVTSADCEKYTLSNWNINIFSNPVPMDLIFIDNGDNTITIPEQEEQNLSEEVATINGSGVVDPITGQILLTIVLVDFDDQPQFTLTLNRN